MFNFFIEKMRNFCIEKKKSYKRIIWKKKGQPKIPIFHLYIIIDKKNIMNIIAIKNSSIYIEKYRALESLVK